MKIFVTYIITIFIFAQLLVAGGTTARLQIIHNAADPDIEIVDIYLNGNLFLDDFAFRTATPFVDVPAEIILKIGIAPADSKSWDDIFYKQKVILSSGSRYILIASGVIGEGFAPNPNERDISFTLLERRNAREESMVKMLIDVLVMNGVTDAPMIDVLVSFNKTNTKSDIPNIECELPFVFTDTGIKYRLANDLKYGKFAGYMPLLAKDILIDITPFDDNSTIMASFNADLTGLEGAAFTIFASGFLNPDDNHHGPAFGLFAAFADGRVIEIPAVVTSVPTAMLQVIHNSADPAAAVVDIWLNDELFIDDFAFRTATEFVEVPAEITLNIGIAPADSDAPDDIIGTIPLILYQDSIYVAVANGVILDGFAPNPDGRDISFTLFSRNNARMTASDVNRVDFSILHGSTDTPTLDILVRGTGILVDNTAYGDFSDYMSFDPMTYILDITPGDDNSTVLAAYEADFSTLSGSAAVIFASGFYNPVENKNGAAFGLFAALASGDVIELPSVPVLPPITGPGAMLQLIHNAADPAAAIIDVWVNDVLYIDNFTFRSATAFQEVAADVTLNIGIAPADSDSPADILGTIPIMPEAGHRYIVVANGVIMDGFAPNPDGRDISFTLFTRDGARRNADMDTQVDLMFLHGATDVPTIDVFSRSEGRWIDNAVYGDFSNYSPFEPRIYTFDISPGDDNMTTLASFEANLSGLTGQAGTVFASGFISPDDNNSGPAFGLFMAMADGNVMELPAVPIPGFPPIEDKSAFLQIIHNAADPAAKIVDVYIDDKLFIDNFTFRTATPFVEVPAEVTLTVGVAPSNSDSPDDILGTVPVMLKENGSYIAVANGVVMDGFTPNPDGRDISLTVFPRDDARQKALMDDMVDLTLLHGVTDGPTVTILGFGICVKKSAYGDMTDYITVKARKNWIVVFTPLPDISLIGVYKIDFTDLAGQAAMVFASGFMDPAANKNGPGLGIFAALHDGTVVELKAIYGPEKYVIIEEILADNNMDGILSIDRFGSPSAVTDFALMQNYPNPFNPSTKIRFSLPETSDISLKVYDIAGRLVEVLAEGNQKAGLFEAEFNASHLPSGIYFYVLKAGDFMQVRRMTLLK